MATRKDRIRRNVRQMRVRNKIKQHSDLPRISVFRSLNHIYAQLINDKNHTTLASSSSLELSKVSGDKKTVAHTVGKDLAKKINALGIKQAAFDRGQFLYHGRIKALAEGLREGGIQI